VNANSGEVQMSLDVIDRSEALDALDEPAQPYVDTSGKPDLYRQFLTGIVAIGPLVVTAFVLVAAFGKPIPWFELALMVLFLFVVGHGVTIGFHRLFTHRAFVAKRPLKIFLAVLGSMSFQGSIIGWVADHRRHHRYSDRPGDPHSPLWIGSTPTEGWRGLWHAHLGWTFRGETTSRAEYAPDLLADPDIVWVDRLWVPCCALTLGLPFLIGYLWTGSVAGGVGALVFAGIIRVGISHNVTWSINSVCHRFGTRAYRTRDASSNVRALAFITMGESWHNNHHAFPRLARHGIDRGQLDSSAACIRLFERLGWATDVQWPDAGRLAMRRIPA
jgi:stearoyl-CoA desaturase (delta-9 desaturase)